MYSQRTSWNLIPCNSINLFSCLSSNLKTQASTDTFPHLFKTPAITKNAQKPRICMFFQQMFSRISEALMKEDTTTLKALRDLVKLIKVTNRIHPRWTWTTSTTWSPWYNYTSLPFNIMDPLTFFVLEKMEKVRMVYLLLADDEQKEWLPEGKPFIIVKDALPGHPTLLKPENTKKCDTWCYGESNGSPQFTSDRGWHQMVEVIYCRWKGKQSNVGGDERGRQYYIWKMGNPLTSALIILSLCPQIKMMKMKVMLRTKAMILRHVEQRTLPSKKN